MPEEKKCNTPGPKPQRVKTDDDFDTVIQRALKKKPLRTVESGGTEPDQAEDNP